MVMKKLRTISRAHPKYVEAAGIHFDDEKVLTAFYQLPGKQQQQIENIDVSSRYRLNSPTPHADQLTKLRQLLSSDDTAFLSKKSLWLSSEVQNRFVCRCCYMACPITTAKRSGYDIELCVCSFICAHILTQNTLSILYIKSDDENKNKYENMLEKNTIDKIKYHAAFESASPSLGIRFNYVLPPYPSLDHAKHFPKLSVQPSSTHGNGIFLNKGEGLIDGEVTGFHHGYMTTVSKLSASEKRYGVYLAGLSSRNRDEYDNMVLVSDCNKKSFALAAMYNGIDDEKNLPASEWRVNLFKKRSYVKTAALGEHFGYLTFGAFASCSKIDLRAVVDNDRELFTKYHRTNDMLESTQDNFNYTQDNPHDVDYECI